MCRQLRHIETQYVPAAALWGEALCARCAIITKLIHIASELPIELEEPFLGALRSFVEMWQRVHALLQRMVADHEAVQNEFDRGDH